MTCSPRRTGFELTAEQRAAVLDRLAWNERQPERTAASSNVAGLAYEFKKALKSRAWSGSMPS